MTDDQVHGNESSAVSHASGTLHGQPITPALSPISEHGDRNIYPFPGYEADDEDTRSPSLSSLRAGGLGIEERTVDNVGIHLPSPRDGNRRKSSGSNNNNGGTSKLSPQQIHELVSSPDSLPVRAIHAASDQRLMVEDVSTSKCTSANVVSEDECQSMAPDRPRATSSNLEHKSRSRTQDLAAATTASGINQTGRPIKGARSASSPLLDRRRSISASKTPREASRPPPLGLNSFRSDAPQDPLKPSPRLDQPMSPMPQVLPLPPLSLPTYLQLELSSDRPSALYLHRSASSDFPYESSKVKFERLYNFLLLPGYLEQVLWFGAVACLDAWLYTFTILPLRFLKAIIILLRWWGRNVLKEIFDLGAFVYEGIGRLRQRGRKPNTSTSRRPSVADAAGRTKPSEQLDATPTKVGETVSSATTDRRTQKPYKRFRHRRTRSTPSALRPNHKADILQGFLIAISCYVLMWFDASRMYHNIRGQSAIKLYVIYNVLEVFDRLFSALGQDILECLFSKETLERNADGRSKVIRPFWMFVLALVYNVVHSTALFYQVVTLNVAVNSYSNALLTLLMSNQFVEIKGTVFKKFEKENLFQLTCADVVERFQLWLMLLIIALRNIVEVGGLTIRPNSALVSDDPLSAGAALNSTALPLMGGIMIPKAFTLMPSWSGELLGPFLIVLGSEMLVDWCKHAYIAKFNNVKPGIYGRFFDVLAKDYYSHAFADQNLTKRLGLPVIPLSCLFIRACVQTYRMLIATHLPPLVPSTATSIALDSEAAATSPATIAAIKHIDLVFRRALGRSSFGAGTNPGSSFSWWSIDDIIALGTMVTFFLVLFLILLACKLVLGMVLLSIARKRYKGMKERERQSTHTDGRRVGGWGVVEVSEDKRRWIYDDDREGLRQLREKEERGGDKGHADKLDSIDRYTMAAKRIW